MGSCANAKDEQFVHLQSRWQTSMLYYKLGGISGGEEGPIHYLAGRAREASFERPMQPRTFNEATFTKPEDEEEDNEAKKETTTTSNESCCVFSRATSTVVNKRTPALHVLTVSCTRSVYTSACYIRSLAP